MTAIPARPGLDTALVADLAITPAHFEELLTWLNGQRTDGTVLVETTQQVMSRTGPP